MKLKYFVGILILLIAGMAFISGCIPEQKQEIKDFKVEYYASYSSAGGTRYLDIIYAVENGEIVSCDGNYTAAMTDKTDVYECDVEKLKAEEYNVPINLITSVTSDQEMEGEVQDGPSFYRWKIIIE